MKVCEIWAVSRLFWIITPARGYSAGAIEAAAVIAGHFGYV